MKTIIAMATAICFVGLSRFVAIAGIEPAQYAKILNAIFYSWPRILIFLIQFVGLAYLAMLAFELKSGTSRAIYLALAMLVLVSVARYFLPLFVVSVVGDLLIIRWLEKSANIRPIKAP
jgi:hypothetical protein